MRIGGDRESERSRPVSVGVFIEGWGVVKNDWWLVLVVGAVAAVLSAGCGDPGVSSSGLPRTTDQGILLTVAESVETLPLPACHTYWMTRNEEPPPGACEQATTVRRFVAQHDAEMIETSVVGELMVDPLYAMQLAARNLTDGVSVVVVIPPAESAVVRLIETAGKMMDRVQPAGDLVALAGLGSDLTVEALSTDGTVIAACPPDGVTIGGITYLCTLASGAAAPITTTLVNDQTP